MKILPDWFTVLCIGNVYFHHSTSILYFFLMLLRGKKQRVPEFVGVFVHLFICKYAVDEGMHTHVCVCVVYVCILIHYFRLFYYNFMRLFIPFNFCLWIPFCVFHYNHEEYQKGLQYFDIFMTCLFHFIQSIYQNVICCVWCV